MQHSVIETRGFEQPDQRLDFASHGRVDIITLADGTTVMHAILEPGWVWSVDEKPLLGNPETCPFAHLGYCISGELIVQMVEAGTETRIVGGQTFEIPPGHDAHVVGDQRCELIMFAPLETTH